MNIKNYLTSALLSASMTLLPLGMTSIAQAAPEKTTPVQVAFLGLGHHYSTNSGTVTNTGMSTVVSPRRHHRLRHVAEIVGGGMIAKHMWKKHKLHRGY